MSHKPTDENEERCLTDDKTRRILSVYFAGRNLVFDAFSHELQAQLIMGYQVELEHGKAVDPRLNVTDDATDLTLRIAMVHIEEVPDYYTRLAVLEREGKDAWAGAKRAVRDSELNFVITSMSKR